MAGNGGTTAFQRIRRLFEAVVDLPVAERTAFLERECGGESDGEVRREVEQLLASDAAEGKVADLLDRGAEPIVGKDGTQIGGKIGSFRLCSVLGSGGMGTVYEAEQERPRRRVALKVLSLGLASERAVRRFRWEAEVLARLQHPHIAQVFEVGVQKSGNIELPWFAMELVPNATDLTTYVERRALSQRERIELLLQTCDAVHHGHVQSVVHRDLKPQNVLVDDRGRVKVIDFGIARSMAGDAHMTEGGIVLGTLHYMSPEQLRGRPADLRSDIYSLGVITYELLAGRRPYVFDETTPLAVAEAVHEKDPPRLGTLVRGIEPDLEVVVHKALRRDPAERYASVTELADDLRAVLESRPVRARAPSTFYQLKMFARRRRGLVTSLTAIAALALIGFGIVLYQGAELARSERVSRRVAQFARDFLSESSLMATKGTDYTVREALDTAAAELDEETFEHPEIEAELRQLIGETYRSLSLPTIAEPQLMRARELWLQIDGTESPRAIRAAMGLVVARRERGRLEKARRLLDEVRERTEPDPDDPVWWSIEHNRAYLLQQEGRLREAEPVFRGVIEARARLLGPDHFDTVVSMHSLGTLLLGLRRPAEARDVLADAVGRAERAEHPPASTWQIADNLGEAWSALGEFDRAAERHRAAMRAFETLVGPDHHITLGCGYHLLKALFQLGEQDEIESIATDLLARCERAFGPDDYRTMDVLQVLAMAHMQAGDNDAAIGHMQRAFRTVGQLRGPAHPGTFNAGHNLAIAQLGATRSADALVTTATLLATASAEPAAMQQMPPGVIGTTWMLRAQALAQAERKPEALDAARRARVLLTADFTAEHPLTQQAAALERELGER